MKIKEALMVPYVMGMLSRSETKPVYTKSLREKFTKLLFEISAFTEKNKRFNEEIRKEFVTAKKLKDESEIVEESFEKYIAQHTEYQKFLNEEAKVKTKITLKDLDESDYDVAAMSNLFGVVIKTEE